MATRVPAWDAMLPLIIYVPAGPLPEERVHNCARVIAMMYDRAARAEVPAEKRKCLWCEAEPPEDRGMIFWSPSDDEPISKAPRGWYCGTECWLAAS